MAVLDRRLNAFRPDLADRRLEGKIEAERFVEGIERVVVTPTAPLHREPRHDAPLDSEALYGETVRVFEETAEGWAWAQLAADGYVGFLPASALGALRRPTHQLTAMRSFLYPGPDMKFPAVAALSRGSRLELGEEVVTRGTPYRKVVGGGAVVAGHVAALPLPPADDFVAEAARFLGTPYLWGGRSAFGIDCSGLVQTALRAAGISAPRDSDQQAASLGEPLPGDSPRQRGDLVFWPGHVGILEDPDTLLHASGHHMEVVREPLAVMADRTRRSGVDISSIKRLPSR